MSGIDPRAKIRTEIRIFWCMIVLARGLDTVGLNALSDHIRLDDWARRESAGYIINTICVQFSTFNIGSIQ